MSKKLYPRIEAGEEVDLKWRTTDFKAACCDCGLVHRMRFKVRGKNLIIMKFWRDERATAQIRRHRPKSL